LIRRAVSLALLSCAVAAPATSAADPIMPLSDVRPGMTCTGLSVLRGTEISSFGVQVIDVIADEPAIGGARILVRVSGPAVEATGVGPGFSGSPILCDGRNAGAISEAVGDYGNRVVLATPIESILTARPRRAPASARRAARLLRSARPLAGPLTVSGLSPGTRRLLGRAAHRAGRTVLAAPPGPLGGYPAQDLRPGATVAASLSSGDLSVGAVGTVAYRAGDDVYAFGHALEGLGRRALFLQDAYVFGVIANPLGVPDLGAITYKLTTSGGHVLGSVTNDTFSAIHGSTGAAPRSIPLRVRARERGGRGVTLNSRLADERALGLGAGMSLVAPLAASTAVDRLLGAFAPVTLRLCARFRVRQLRKPIGFCNTYFDNFRAFGQVAEAASLVESFDLAPLAIRGAGIGMTVRRGVVDDVIVGAVAPKRVHRGERMRVRLALRRRGADARRLSVRVPVPRGLRPGRQTLVIEGNGTPGGEDEVLFEIVDGLTRAASPRAGARRPNSSGARAEPPAGRGARSEPRTVRQLARRVAALGVPVGITARFGRRRPRVVLRSDAVRFEGRANLSVRVLRERRGSS
jgi:hypothetical protein